MPALYLTPQVYDDIRAAIQLDLSPKDIPDRIIEMDQFSGAAERDVIALTAMAVPTPPGRGTTEFIVLVSAAIQFCAARLVGSLPLMISERFVAYDYRRVPINEQQKIQALVQRGLQYVAQALNVDIISLIQPATMVLAEGGRGNTRLPRWTWSGGPVFMGPY